MALNRSDKSRILRRYFPGMTRNSEMSTEPKQVMAFVLGITSASLEYPLAFIFVIINDVD